MVVINFLHVIQNLPILQSMSNRSQASMFVFQSKLFSNLKLFADNTLLFSVVHNITDSPNLLNSDLSKINEWVLQWKLRFNPDPLKQVQEITFSRKTSKGNKSPGPYV